MHSSSQISAVHGESRATPALASMSWRDVERLIGEQFRRRGFTVTGFGGEADIALMKQGQRFLVECKQWHKQQVGLTAVRGLGLLIRAAGARGGYLFTCGEFTREACELAHGGRVELLDGRSIIDWLRAPKPRIIAPSIAHTR